MTIRHNQIMYKVRGPDGRWAKKTGDIFKIKWVDNEESATFWKKLHHLKASLKEGVFSQEENRDGLPPEAFHVYEFSVEVKRTGRRRRLAELDRFYEESA